MPDTVLDAGHLAHHRPESHPPRVCRAAQAHGPGRRPGRFRRTARSLRAHAPGPNGSASKTTTRRNPATRRWKRKQPRHRQPWIPRRPRTNRVPPTHLLLARPLPPGRCRTRARPHTRTTGRRRDPLDAHADAGGRRPTHDAVGKGDAGRAPVAPGCRRATVRQPGAVHPGPAGSATGAVRGGDSPLRLERGRSAVSRRLEPVSLVPAHSGSDGIPGPPAAGTASRHASRAARARRWRKPMFWQAIKHGDSLETLCREAPDLAVLDIGAGATTAARRGAGS